MASESLFKLKTRARKLALYSKERVDLAAFTTLRPDRLSVVEKPFPHVIIDDFFLPDTYLSLSQAFAEVEQRGFLEEAYGLEYFHKFNMDYDGYVYVPRPTLDPQNPLAIFFSLEWNAFFSKLFKQFTTFETEVAFHHHPPGNKTGFVHHDSADRFFSSQMQLPNGIIYGDGVPPRYQSRRKIAILYFLNNDGWREGDGGEIGLYSPDGKTLVKKVAPLNNRILAFRISATSNHAFQENKRSRNSIVQWFHVPGEYA